MEVYPVVLDWIQILEDLNQKGITTYHLSQELGYTFSTVQRWASGSEPRESAGRAILEYHRQLCGEHLTNQRIKQGKPQTGRLGQVCV